MFNVINSKTTCPTCHKPVEWQSKYLTYAGYVLENLLQNITLNKYIDGEIHTLCDHCKKAVEITIKKGREGAIKPREVYKKGLKKY